MLNDVLKERGTIIVKELELNNSHTIEKWMAHYLTELMHKAETASSEGDRQKAEELCSTIILNLWEQKIQKLRHEFYFNLGNAFRNVYEKREFGDILREILDDFENLKKYSEFMDYISIMLYIDFYESDLLRLSLISYIASTFDENESQASEQVLDEFESTEQIFLNAKKHIIDLWPDLEQFNLKDAKKIHKFTKDKIKLLHELRSLLVLNLS